MIIFGRLQEKILDHPLSAAYLVVSSKLLSDYTVSLMIEVLQVCDFVAVLRCSPFKNSFPSAL